MFQTGTNFPDKLTNPRFQRFKQFARVNVQLCPKTSIEFATCRINFQPSFRGPKDLDFTPIGKTKLRNGIKEPNAVLGRQVRSSVFDFGQKGVCALDEPARWT